MNIFVLHPSASPAACAAYHCDQHIHKMILESAQMLSTATLYAFSDYQIPPELRSILYKPAYHKHPCTIWTASSNNNMLWLCDLAIALQDVRESVANCGEHRSIPVIRSIKEFLHHINPFSCASLHTPHVFCGPATISYRLHMTTVQRYQEFYRRKATRWPLDSGIHMTYKGRSIPPFLTDLIPATTTTTK